MVGARGFEPRTSCAQGRRATRLRYAPTVTALFILKHFPTLLLIRKAIATGPARIAYGQSIGAVVPGDAQRLELTVVSPVEGPISLSVDGKFWGVPLEGLVEGVIWPDYRGPSSSAVASSRANSLVVLARPLVDQSWTERLEHRFYVRKTICLDSLCPQAGITVNTTPCQAEASFECCRTWSSLVFDRVGGD